MPVLLLPRTLGGGRCTTLPRSARTSQGLLPSAGSRGSPSGTGQGAGRPGKALTGVRAQVAGERVPPAAGVVAEVALEGLLARVQLDVAQQVALLREGGPALVALERPLAWGETGGERCRLPGPEGDTAWTERTRGGAPGPEGTPPDPEEDAAWTGGDERGRR